MKDRSVIVLTIIFLAFVLFVLFNMSGCGSNKEEPMYSRRMKYAGHSIENGIDCGYIWIDRETGVCYLESCKGDFTIMLNRDGSPYIANGWRDYE